MSSPILWENHDRSVVLIDIPRSIAAAQGSHDHPCSDSLLSTEPSTRPFVTNEPKTAAAKAKLVQNTTDAGIDLEYQGIIQAALRDVNDNYKGDWCLPRPFVVPSTVNGPGEKRKHCVGDDLTNSNAVVQAIEPELPHDLLASCDSISRSTASCQECPDDDPSFHSNCYSSTQSIEIQHVPEDGERNVHSFRIPLKATFSLSACSSSQSFMNGIRNQAQTHSTRRHFDIILLDPPWPNRSVKRARKSPGSSYATSSSLHDIYQLLAGMDLDMLMSEECLVGIWITNKSRIRDLVLGDDGVFAMWGLRLEEEWIWVKTTSGGEPVTPIDSVWRKPYETLLIGRKGREVGEAPKRRVIISVPDLHSRKPCLKLLLEPMAPRSDGCRVLEVFARHLVAGWWSWGNECIKFNWDGYWRAPVGNRRDESRTCRRRPSEAECASQLSQPADCERPADESQSA
ncbi:uncharacterized protein MYCGRDRAFT_75907 [Zymoseptoria tritici IPO323]|uniref:MT-A70-domain-containing protein n=1 Tax=Zymoseptoria tritici (strain CBS 115943 / IPO323) TaxID=336722 RepID=F9XKD3_ZYMTI|nr:uncharacterized protein MYCGRDRAFT_75907 [Zymoseptoria tritici IPO323]EGP84504.1 hypothetical protein MYCGRDRAFT_75907 [Zymoseptoria tritici IPO323]